MATNTEISQHVDIELESLRLMLGDLADVADEWDQLPGAEQASWSLDWDQLMGGLKVILDPAYRSGTMSSGQHTRYVALLCSLREALPLMNRIGLYPPPVSLEP